MKLLWLDLETTGLDPHNDEILEVAAAVADLENPFEPREWFATTLRYPGGPRPSTDPFVAEMHTKSGLWREAEASAVEVAEVERELLRRIDVDPTDRDERTTIAGSSIAFDLSFLRAWMPALARQLHHRVYDVSSVALFCRSLGMPRVAKAEAHRATPDLIESIALAQACARWLGRSPGGAR